MVGVAVRCVDTFDERLSAAVVAAVDPAVNAILGAARPRTRAHRLMHELGITSRLLEVVLERAAAAGVARISEIHLEIGEESDVAPAAVQHYWPQVSGGTAADGARLVFSVAADSWACRSSPSTCPTARPSRKML